jgi:hypothetical protein
VALALGTRWSTLAAVASAIAAIALAAAVAGGSCRVARPGPEVAVGNLLQAAAAADRDAIYQLLTPATQARLAAEAQRAIDLNGGSVRYTAKDMISIGSSKGVSAPSAITVIQQHGDRAIVEIVVSTGRSRLELEKSGGQWRISFPSYGR